MSKAFVIILLIGVILRLFLSATTFHPDIRLLNIGAEFISSGNILNLYDYLSALPEDHFLRIAYPVDLLIYPPAIFFFHGLFNIIFGNLFADSFINTFLVNVVPLLGKVELNLHLLFLKMPYLIFDLMAAYFLSQLFTSKKEKIIAFTLWMFNPVTLYATYFMGQFDIIPTAFVILSLFIVSRNIKQFNLSSNQLAALSLGVGAAFKIYPLYFLIPLASMEEKWSERIKIMLLGILPYVITILPFLPSSGYRSSALLAGHTLKSFYSQIPVSGGEAIILFLAAVIFFYLLFLYSQAVRELLWQRFFVVLLLFFIFTHYHPQWFLWLTPFLIIDLVQNKFKYILVTMLLLGSFTALLFFFDPSLTMGLFSPILPSLYYLPSIWEIIGVNPDYNFFRSIFHTISVGAATFYILIYSLKKN